MQKQKRNNTAIFVVNAIVVSLILLNKKYKPLLEKLGKQYIELKNASKNTTSQKKKEEFRKKQTKMVEEVKNVIDPTKNLVGEAFASFSIDEISKYSLLSTEEQNFLYEKICMFMDQVGNIFMVEERLAYIGSNLSFEEYRIDNRKEYTQTEYSQMEQIGSSLALAGIGGSTIETTSHNSAFTESMNKILRTISWSTVYSTLIARIALTLFGLGEDLEYGYPKYADVNSAVMNEIEDYFSDPTLVNMSIETIVKETTFYIPEKEYHTQYNNILSREDITMDDKIEQILHGDLTNTRNTFNFVLGIENASLEEKREAILHSGLADCTEIYDFLLSREELPFLQTMEAIVYSDVGTFEEKFDCIVSQKRLSSEQKIWFTLLIPNTPFEKVYQNLYQLPEVTEEQIIENTIRANIIPFTTLFNTVLNHNTLDSETIAYYIVSYNDNYNSVSIEEKFTYIQGIERFDEEVKIDYGWEVLKDDTLEQFIPGCYGLTMSEKIILDYYGMDFNDYLALYKISTEEQTIEQRIVFQLFEKINDVKKKYVLEHYFENENQFTVSNAIIAAEGGDSYYDLYWVSNTGFNRTIDKRYIKSHGTSPYQQLIADGQFIVYETDKYEVYLYSNSIKAQYSELALCNMFYAGYEGRAHDYTEFRSSYVDIFSNNRAIDYTTGKKVSGGNRYGGRKLQESDIVIHEDLVRNSETLEETTSEEMARVLLK